MGAGDEKVQTTLLTVPTDNHILAFLRKKGEKEVLVLLNLSPYPSKFALSVQDLKGKFKELFSSEKKDCSDGAQFELQQWGYKVYMK